MIRSLPALFVGILTMLQASLGQSLKVVFIQMDPSRPVSFADSYRSTLDLQKVSQDLPLHHPLLHLADYTDKEPVVFNSSCIDPIAEACFLPEMKMVLSDVTYVFGNHLAHAIKFKNTAPYSPGPQMLPLDFLFTETTLLAANQVRDQLFDRGFAQFFQAKGLPTLVPMTAAYRKQLATSVAPEPVTPPTSLTATQTQTQTQT
ncbi:MAG: hypothetical protein ACK50T_00155, partial [Sphingobacteriia bacterium]